MKYSIRSAPILTDIYQNNSNRLKDKLIPDINKGRSFKILQQAIELEKSGKTDELLELLNANEDTIKKEYFERTPNFFLHCRIQGAYYTLFAIGLLDQNDSCQLPDVLKCIRLAFVYQIWQLMFDIDGTKEERQFEHIVNEHISELPPYNGLEEIEEKYSTLLQDHDQYFISAEKDLFCLALVYDIISFYNRRHVHIDSLTRAIEMRVATECIYSLETENDFYEEVCKCATDIMDGIINTDDINKALELIKKELVMSVPSDPFVSEWEKDDFTYSIAAEYVAAHIHPQLKPIWYYRYEAERNLNKIHKLKDVITKNNSKIMSLSDKVTNLEREIAIRNNEFSVLKAEKIDLARKNNTLSNKIEELLKSQDVLSKSVANQKRSVNGASRKQNKELVKLSTDYSNLRSKFDELSKQKEDYVRKYQDAISEKIALSDKISELREELRKKTKELEALSVQDIEEESVVVTEKKPVAAEEDTFANINLKIAVAGGTDSWRAKVIARHPKFKDIGNGKSFDTQKLNDVDLLVINTNNVSHACTMKASANTPENGRVLYTSYYNLDLLDAQIKGRLE